MGKKTFLTVQEILSATYGYLYNDANIANGFASVTTDSRNVCEDSLFIPLIGEFQDGHKYVDSACKSGASIIFVQESSIAEYKSIYENCTSTGAAVIVVKNTLTALQNIAKAYVSKFPNLIKIAITGSNGKTTAKECIGAVLSQKYNTVMNVGNLNSETGLPLSMFNIRSEHEVGIFEMGMNRRGEIKELSDVFFPNLALITNIGTAHIGILGTKDAIAEEKKQIFANFNKDCTGYIFEKDSYIDFLKKDVEGTMLTYGIKSTEGIKAITSKGISGTSIQYNDTEIHFPLVGEHNVYNACAAIAIAQHLGLTSSEIKKGLEAVKPLFGRSQILEGNPTIIQDCYNGSFESMSASLDFFLSLQWSGKKVAVLGDMLELGENSSSIHEKILNRILESSVEMVIFVGECFSNEYNKNKNIAGKKVFYTAKIDDDSITQLCEEVKAELLSNDCILVKGSRGIKLERVISHIQEYFCNKEAV